MKFVVSRTSSRGYSPPAKSPKPCEKAKRSGQSWEIDIKSLRELLGLIKDGEEIVIRCDVTTRGKIYEIEFYDDYRE